MAMSLILLLQIENYSHSVAKALLILSLLLQSVSRLHLQRLSKLLGELTIDRSLINY